MEERAREEEGEEEGESPWGNLGVSEREKIRAENCWERRWGGKRKRRGPYLQL